MLVSFNTASVSPNFQGKFQDIKHGIPPKGNSQFAKDARRIIKGRKQPKAS